MTEDKENIQHNDIILSNTPLYIFFPFEEFWGNTVAGQMGLKPQWFAVCRNLLLQLNESKCGSKLYLLAICVLQQKLFIQQYSHLLTWISWGSVAGVWCTRVRVCTFPWGAFLHKCVLTGTSLVSGLAGLVSAVLSMGQVDLWVLSAPPTPDIKLSSFLQTRGIRAPN